MIKTLLAMTLCTLVASCNSSNYADGQSNQSDSQSQADWQITAKVKEAILSDSSLAPGNRFVSVSTTNGVVTLTGNISSQDQINKIVKKAGSVSGVKRVQNNMLLSP